MTKLSEFANDQSYLRLPRLDRSQVSLLWFAEYYDGPMSGLLETGGRKYWFQAPKDYLGRYDEIGDEVRHYLVIELSPEQLAEEEEWHDLFREKVGTQYDPYENVHPPVERYLRPQEMHAEYFDAAESRTPLDLSQNRVIGWFAGDGVRETV